MRRGALVALAVATAAGVGAAASVGAGVHRPGAAASDAQYEKKVTICHRTGSKKNPYRTIRVSRNAVKAHLRHGDALGPCDSAVFTMCAKTKKGKRVTMKVKGARKAQRLMRTGGKHGKCKAKGKPAKPGDKGKDKDKGKGKGKGKGK